MSATPEPTRIFHRSTRARPPLATGGSGIELVAEDGRRFIDACGGAAVSCLGHGHPQVIAAIAHQAKALAYAHTSFFSNAPAEALGEALAASAPAPLRCAYLVDDGSSAVETALKMARQYHLERGQRQRTHIISRRMSYHGNTLGALGVSGHLSRRAPYEPLLVASSRIEPCFAYRYARTGETPQTYAYRAADALEIEIQRLGPERVMCFIAETVVGASCGAVPPAPGYFARIREICDRHGVLLILDEVMCGAGRTGTFLACEQDGIVPDLVTLAKGLAGGYQPIGAVLCSQHVYAAFADGSGAFVNGHTYSAHPVACAAALAVQKVIREENLLARVRASGDELRARLAARFALHPHVGDVRGRGLLMAIELVANRDTHEPFDVSRQMSSRVKACAFERGLLVYPGSGTIDGRRGDHILLAPPYNVTSVQLELIVEGLAAALDAACADQSAA